MLFTPDRDFCVRGIVLASLRVHAHVGARQVGRADHCRMPGRGNDPEIKILHLWLPSSGTPFMP
jgi:hypothetical protein